MIDRLFSLLVALSLAVLVWLYVRTRDPEVLDNVPVPVQVSLPPSLADRYDLEVGGPGHVPVSFRGPPSGIRELREVLQRGELEVRLTVAVPEDQPNESRYVETLRVDASDVHAPPGVAPLVLEGRNRIPVTLRRIVQRRLPVRLDPPPAPEDGVARVVLDPATVVVRGPKVILDRLRSIPTVPYPVPTGAEAGANQEATVGPVPLVRELDGRPVTVVPDAVTVRLNFRYREKIYEIKDQPIDFLCPANYPYRPRFLDRSAGKVTLRVSGPPGEVPPSVVVYLDLTMLTAGPGVYADEPLQLQLPAEFRLAQPTPRAPPFRLVPGSEPKARPD